MNILKLTASGVAGNVNTDFVASGDMEILYGQVILTTDATVANRRVLFQIIDDAGTPAVIFDSHSGAVVTASLTNYHHEMMPGIYRETAFVGSALQVPIPWRCIIPNGYGLRLNIDAGVAGDSYEVDFMAKSLGAKNE